MDLLASMNAYVLVVEKGSLAAAAAACGMSATMVGNHVRALEERLSAQLMHRTTRRQYLTAFGEAYYQRCKEILRLVAETDAQAQHMRIAPAGILRISAPVTFGTEALVPALGDYLERYPEVDVELDLSDRIVDLAAEGFDAAVRIGPLPQDANLVARPLASYRLMMCAAPAYLARRGTPRVPADLAGHDCLAFHGGAAAQWHLQEGGAALSVPVSSRVSVNNDQALRAAALHGLGIVLQPALLLEAEVWAGRLVPLLSDYQLPGRPAHLVYLPDRYRSAKLRSFIDYLGERFARADEG